MRGSAKGSSISITIVTSRLGGSVSLSYSVLISIPFCHVSITDFSQTSGRVLPFTLIVGIFPFTACLLLCIFTP